MTDLDFSLRGFSFKMRGWEGPIDVDLVDDNCAVLVGINAGGKTLAMRVLREFSNLLDRPSARGKKYFERFAQDSGVESVSVNFSYGLIDADGEPKVGWINHNGQPDFDIMKDFLRFTDDWQVAIPKGGEDPTGFQYDLRIVLETKVTIADQSMDSEDGGTAIYERRHGLEATTGLLAVGVAGSEMQEESEWKREKGWIYDQWKSIFTNEEKLEGMLSYGPTIGLGDWEDDLRKLTGLSFENAIGADGFEHWEIYGRAISFNTQVPEMLDVSGAYEIDEHGMREINEMEGRFTQPGKIAEIFGAAHKRQVELAMEHYRSAGILDLITSIFPDDNPFPIAETWAKEFVDDGFLVEYNGDGASEPLLDETGLPLHVPDTKIRGKRVIEILSEFEEDFSRWLALRRFEGLTELNPDDYFSSGQKRILGMFSALMALGRGSAVLIDEPELSLHIDWQRNLISALSDGFPNLSFVFATHSPDVIMNHPEKVVAVPPSEEV